VNIVSNYRNKKICDACEGKGTQNPEDVTTCSRCKGRGVRVVTNSKGPFQMQSEEVCDKCGGNGVIFKSKCPKCGGARHVNGEDMLVVKIPAGIPEGYQVLFTEASDQVVGYTPGDVQVIITTAPHPKFERKGDDLWTTITLNLLDALVGCTISIEHLDGHIVQYEKETVSSHGEILKIANEGMPKFNGYGKGILYVKILLEFPDYFTSEQKEELKNLLLVA